MLPGFIPRLHAELVRAMTTSPTTSTSPPQRHPRKKPPQAYSRYAALHSLAPYVAIVNNPAPPPPQTSRASANAGKAPAFTPATLAWVGGSLAG